MINDKNLEKVDSLLIVPNPATERATLSYNRISEDQKVELAIFDLTGRLLENTVLQKSISSWEVDTSSFATGTYIVIVVIDGKVRQQKKLVIK